MDTQEMLKKISTSSNETCARTARKILNGETTIEEELKYEGSFMTAVLKGDYEEALNRADSENYYALTGKFKYNPYTAF